MPSGGNLTISDSKAGKQGGAGNRDVFFGVLCKEARPLAERGRSEETVGAAAEQ